MILLRNLLLTVLLLSAVMEVNSQKNPYQGITDEKVLPMLKHLPHVYGGMNVPALDGRLLYDIVIDKGYIRGLEIGTSNGYSTLWLGLAFRETGGEVVTIEIDDRRGKEAQENFRKAGLDHVIDARINDAFKEIPEIEGDFDFIFLDAWKPDYYKYYKLLYPRLKEGGTLAAHNVRSQEYEMRDFLDAVQNNPDMETVINRDSFAGVLVSVKRK